MQNMHQAAREYVSRYATDAMVSVIEIGSRNINGTIRDLFPRAQWMGLDLQDGFCVDHVCDATSYQPMLPVDLVICCEVLEHAADWMSLIEAGASWLAPGGRLIVTCAGPGRTPHSAHDGGDLRANEHYCNITTEALCRAMQACGIWIDSADTLGQDTRASGRLAG